MSDSDTWDVRPPDPEAQQGSAEEKAPRATFLNTVNPILLWILALLMTAGAMAILWWYIPSRQSDIQRKGQKTDGKVVMKDSMPLGDGRTIFTVMFTYIDSERKNHEAHNQVGEGLYEDLKPNKDVIVYYLPDQQGMAFIKGSDAIEIRNSEGGAKQVVRVIPPHAAALSFVAWTMLFGSVPIWIMAYLASNTPRFKKKKGVIVTRRR